MSAEEWNSSALTKGTITVTTYSTTTSAEITALAGEIWVQGDAADFTAAIRLAGKLITPLQDFADAWDAQSAAMLGESEAYERSDPMSQCTSCDEWIEDAVLADGCPSCAAATLELETLLYVPSALTPAEQRAMDKALYQLARGIIVERVGRFWMVPSRTSGGTVYRTTRESCSCPAGEASRPCWHRFAAGIVAEQQPAPKMDDARYAELVAAGDELFS
jgi:hypothetical protein